MAYIPMPMHTTRQIECIIQSGRKYCEMENLTPRQLGGSVLFFTFWMIAIGVCIWKGGENVEHDKAWFTLALIIFIAPFVLMIIFG